MKMTTNKIIITLVLFCSGLSGFLLSLYMHQSSSTVSVPLQQEVIQTYHYPDLFVKQLKGDRDAGRKIFKEFCASCHARQPTIDVAAPRIGDKKAWEIRRKLGINILLKITTQGVAAMPARGGCFECSDDQLRETIQYILDQSK